MAKTQLYAREGVAFDETVAVRDTNGNAVDLTGFALSLAMFQQAGGSAEFTLTTGVTADAQGLHIVEGGLRIVIDKATLEGVDDDTGEFDLFGDLLGDAAGGTAYSFVTDVRLNCTVPGKDFRGATYQVTLDALAADVIAEVQEAGDAKIALATAQADRAAAARDDALESAAELLSAWDEDTTALAAPLDRLVDKIELFGPNTDRLRVSLVREQEGEFQIVVSDDFINDEVGSFKILGPDYETLPGSKIPFAPIDPLSALPSGDSNGANATNLWGFLTLKEDAAFVIGSVTQYTTDAQGRINRRNIHSLLPAQVRQYHADLEKMGEVIEVGGNKAFTDSWSAIEDILGGPLADRDNPNQFLRPTRAAPNHQIGLLVDPANIEEVSLHLPDYVHLFSRVKHGVVFTHSAGAGRSIIEAHGNSFIYDCVIRNDIATASATSAPYGVHSDGFHLIMTADALGRYNLYATGGLIGCQLIIGPNADVQVSGNGIGVNNTRIVKDCDLYCENPSYNGLIIAANNGSGAFGGGRMIIDNVTDRTGRSVPAVGVQTKNNTTNPAFLEVKNSPTIERVSLAPAGTPYAGKWKLLGNTCPRVVSTIPGDTMGADFALTGGPPQAIIGATHTLSAIDGVATRRTTSSSSVTITVPPHAVSPFRVGQRFEIERGGTGGVTIAAGSGVTVNSPGGLQSIASRYSKAWLEKVAPDTWTLTGDLA